MTATPTGFPVSTVDTANRQVLTAIVAGELPPPSCVDRFLLPAPSAWSYGFITGTAEPTDAETWEPGVVFGGYLACLVDQFAGLVMLTVLPDGAGFLTYGLSLDLRAPVRPGEVVIEARIRSLAAREAIVDVELSQDGRVTSRAAVTQVIRPAAGERTDR